MRLRNRRCMTVVGLIGVLAANPTSLVQDEVAKLLASDGAAADCFGKVGSVSGDLAVIGAEQDDDNGNSSGSAYVFWFDGSAWLEEAKLTACDGAASDLFGCSVSISGDTAEGRMMVRDG